MKIVTKKDVKEAFHFIAREGNYVGENRQDSKAYCSTEHTKIITWKCFKVSLRYDSLSRDDCYLVSLATKNDHAFLLVDFLKEDSFVKALEKEYNELKKADEDRINLMLKEGDEYREKEREAGLADVKEYLSR